MRPSRHTGAPSLLVIVLGVVGVLGACAGRPQADADHGDEAPIHATDQPASAIERLDAELARRWAAAEIQPSPHASDAEFLRRASLDLRGRVPTHAEVERFLADARPDKRARAIDELLASEDFAAHWAGRWVDRLLPQDRRARRYASEPLETYLGEVLAQNQPWDQVVTELLDGSGTIDDEPRLAYLGARARNFGGTRQDALAELSSTTARVFLGARIECAQCHDHPYAHEFSREDFWAQTAYFGRTIVSLDRGGGEPAIAIAERGRGELRVALGGDDDLRKRAIAPRFLGEDRSSLDPEQPRRAQLAAAIVDDPRFAEASVGWVWTQLLGRGIVEPWDDLLADVDRPALLALLAAEFRASGHDMRALIRTIVLSQAYQRSSAGPETTPAQVAAAEIAFARAPVRSLSAEQLFASLLTVTELEQIDDRRFRRLVRSRRGKALREYEFVFADDDEMAGADGFSGNVPQALLLLNGGLTNQGVVRRPGASLDRILGDHDDTDARLRDLWLTIYARPPRADELELGREAVGSGRDADWEDLMFAMLYSSEFSSNH